MMRPYQPTDLPPFLETLSKRRHFDAKASIIVTRAPGRLDVMGGIADYSGSLVLQRPIAEATFVALQPSDQPVIDILSFNPDSDPHERAYSMELSSLAPGGDPISYENLRAHFDNSGSSHWASYVVGVFLVLMRERGASFRQGGRILISSRVPEGKGVASSAALEVAVMQAVSAAFDVKLAPQELALLCQTVENRVAGAACGIMDQMTCACAEADSLLALLCQPAELQTAVHLPDEVSFWGLDSGERHAVSGSDYESVRAGTFMGHRMTVWNDARWGGYLANVSPSEFEREFASHLPEQMTGKEFLQRYSGTADTVTQVANDRTYRIRQPTVHAVFESHRVRRFRELLQAPGSEEQRKLLGELMYKSHDSYSACGLGSSGTDLIVKLVREAGPGKGLYGARITGGGSGGTVAVLGRADSRREIEQIVESYESITGHRPYIFSGSSAGAAAFGFLRLNL